MANVSIPNFQTENFFFPYLCLSRRDFVQVVELKVGLHCDECIKKILKAIKKIEGYSSLLYRFLHI